MPGPARPPLRREHGEAGPASGKDLGGVPPRDAHVPHEIRGSDGRLAPRVPAAEAGPLQDRVQAHGPLPGVHHLQDRGQRAPAEGERAGRPRQVRGGYLHHGQVQGGPRHLAPDLQADPQREGRERQEAAEPQNVGLGRAGHARRVPGRREGGAERQDDAAVERGAGGPAGPEVGRRGAPRHAGHRPRPQERQGSLPPRHWPSRRGQAQGRRGRLLDNVQGLQFRKQGGAQPAHEARAQGRPAEEA
mmetsp:Transcript_98292/g.306065  ORF Transcript_98292/g.306065 Transcript_98292/m.306065 type:complete len:246 (+) Transcript_98292:785-1522(+)